jgi:NSS family neurotransmitter:Na+ symporter
MLALDRIPVKHEPMSASPPGKPALWSSGYGFLLAALGAAVGLGNIWRFSYVVGENGGGAFIIVYVAAVLLLGWPLLIAELALGRSTRADAVTAFDRIAPSRPWRWAGWIGALACIAILSYYPVVTGWVVNYLWRYLHGAAAPTSFDGPAAQFRSLISDPAQALLWTTLVMVVTVAIVAAGVERGIERACTILMPAFILLLLLLGGYGLSLAGAGRAIAFLFTPDWVALTKPQTYLAAIGQAFFSIGLGMGVLLTYGAYVPVREKLPRAALLVVLGDTLIALLAGLVIFPAVFTYGVDPARGPTLAFVALPEVFAVMPGGRWFAIAFFLLLGIAALTSSVSLLEVPVAWAIARWQWRRERAAAAIGMIALALCVPVALGYGLLAPERLDSPVLLERIDYLSSNILLPLSGIAVALSVGWAWNALAARAAADLATTRAGALWYWSMRIALPVTIGLVMGHGLGWI